MMLLKEIRLGIIGLGYVGLPLATEFGLIRNVIGYDISNQRIKELFRETTWQYILEI